MQGLQKPAGAKERDAALRLTCRRSRSRRRWRWRRIRRPAFLKAPTVRFHHLHFRTDDFAGALTTAAGTHGGTRTILEGLGPGVRVGDVYLLFERPPDDR